MAVRQPVKVVLDAEETFLTAQREASAGARRDRLRHGWAHHVPGHGEPTSSWVPTRTSAPGWWPSPGSMRWRRTARPRRASERVACSARRRRRRRSGASGRRIRSSRSRARWTVRRRVWASTRSSCACATSASGGQPSAYGETPVDGDWASLLRMAAEWHRLVRTQTPRPRSWHRHRREVLHPRHLIERPGAPDGPDGRAVVEVGTSEMGNGTTAVLAALVAAGARASTPGA